MAVPAEWANCVDGVVGGHIITAIQDYLFVPSENWPAEVNPYFILNGDGTFTEKLRLGLGFVNYAYGRNNVILSNEPRPAEILNDKDDPIYTIPAQGASPARPIPQSYIRAWVVMNNFLQVLAGFPNDVTHQNPGMHQTYSLLYCPLIWQAVKKYRDSDAAAGIDAHPDVPDVPAAWLTYGQLPPTAAGAPLYKKAENERVFLAAARELARNTEFMQFMIATLRNPPAGMAVPPRVAPREVNTREVRSVPRVNAPRTTGQRAVLTPAQMSAFSNIERDLRSIGLGGRGGGKRSVRYTTRRRRLAKKKSTRGKRRS